MTTDKIFFQKIFRRGENDKGGKMTEGITVLKINRFCNTVYRIFNK